MEPPSKNQFKNEKIQRKFLESQSIKLNSNDFQTQGQQFIILDIQKIQRKAKKWWHLFDQSYFKILSFRQTLSMRDQVSNQKLCQYFSTQSQIKGSYITQQITSYYQLIKDQHLLHVLFKSSTPYYMFLVSYQLNRETSKLDQVIQGNQSDFKVTCLKQNKITNFMTQSQQCKIKNGNSKQISYQLQMLDYCSNQQFCLRTQKTSQILSKFKHQNQIDQQIALWENQLNQINGFNSIYWNSIITNFKNQKSQIRVQQSQIFQIKQKLMWNDILRYFQHGLRDKTRKMLQILIQSQKLMKPAKSREINQSNYKKFFQTDCKICFCSFNSESNQVLYCDQCNTSFHLTCYGLNSIPQQKQYFCQCCRQMKKSNRKKEQVKKLSCQICCKQNFPMKCINGHFYHVTCLVLFGFIQINQGTLQLKQSLKHQDIIKIVVQNQIFHKQCQFCASSNGSQLGLQLKCSFKDCQEEMHPICAYINGCKFVVKKEQSLKALDVKIYCNKHDYQRDYIQQAYFRRYMCNFKNTSKKKFEQFKEEYALEVKSRQSKLIEKNKQQTSIHSLLNKSKIVKKYILGRQQKDQQSRLQFEGTQSRKMLQKLYKKIV